MSFGNPSTQTTDLQQAALAGSYDWYLEREGAWLGDSSEGSINIAWILAIANAVGNATTKALADTAWWWPEPEWGWDTTGPGQDIATPDQQIGMWGGGIGGFIQSW
jgi:hypothetical protein